MGFIENYCKEDDRDFGEFQILRNFVVAHGLDGLFWYKLINHLDKYYQVNFLTDLQTNQVIKVL